ncbi:hypothetical protein [uncultured Catenibacterium sp.]|uniref:hypothetical protein n=1 Tax=uncultured Catenibacterium sp. TaxID=286142 RepID=UPI002614A1CC|nr:hypothetical protein [uncultured Catenibacterium sp.]
MKTKKILVEVVAATMIVAPLAQPARVFNVHALDTTPVVQTTTKSPELQNATVLIPSDATVEQVTEILNKALIKNLDNVDTSKIEWEYQCEGENGLLKNTAWGSINGFESNKKVVFVPTTFTHPSLAANSDGSYQVRIKGTTKEVTVTKAAKHTSAIEVNDNVEVTLPYDEDANVNYDALKDNIFNSVVKSSTPELTVDDVTIQYYATGKIIIDAIPKKDWTSLEGSKDTFTEYPAISAGTQKIKISYNGNDTYYGAEKEVNITVKDRTPADITVNKGQTIKLAYNDDLTVDYDQVEKDIFDKVIATSTPQLTADDVTIQYHAKGLVGLTNKWVSVKGEKVYPAISEGEHEIRIIYKGSKDYQPHTVETTINVVDRATVDVVKNEGPYNVSMKFNKDQSYDYDATAKAIYEAVIKSTNPELSFEDFKVEYNPDLTGASNLVGGVWYELNNKNAFNLNKFKAGTWKIKLSWNATKEYKAGNVIVEVNVEDNRLGSAVTLKDGATITYNMDAQEMKKALFKSIDFSKSTLPSKDELSVDDFTYEYYGTNVVAGNIDGGIKQWAPVEGGKVTLLDYPQMPAGEQKVRITYKGNSDYRPSTSGETTITVKKAKVKVSVHSTNIFADEELSKDFIATNPADKFDVYTVYAGATSNVSLGLYLDLPARFTDSNVLKLLDPVVKEVFGKTFTQMMQDGVTVGELRKLFSTQQLLELLDKLHIDTGTFGQILKVINKLPGIADNVRIGFGTPNRPGLYAVTAVTDNKNYETGVGIGALLVKQHVKGVKLVWNQKLTKISKEEAQNFDFKATVTCNGKAVSDENVHYLYTGVQSNLKPYSSTTTAPTEPGVYTMTVVTIGGNYKASPITRTFTITK